MQFLLAAAEQNHAEAQFNYAVMLTTGKRHTEALSWYEAAAKQGHIVAMSMLGTFYANGDDGTPRDIQKALHWWWLASEKGDPEAFFSLGVMYSAPYLPELAEFANDIAGKDAVLGYSLYTLALKGGLAKSEPNLKALAGKMTSTQINDGKALADRWIYGLSLLEMRKADLQNPEKSANAVKQSQSPTRAVTVSGVPCSQISRLVRHRYGC